MSFKIKGGLLMKAYQDSIYFYKLFLRAYILCMVVSFQSGAFPDQSGQSTKGMNITVTGPQDIQAGKKFTYMISLENVPGQDVAESLFYYVHPSELAFEKFQIPNPEKFNAIYTKDLKRIFGRVISSKENDNITFSLEMRAPDDDLLKEDLYIASYFMFVVMTPDGKEREYYRRHGLKISKPMKKVSFET